MHCEIEKVHTKMTLKYSADWKQNSLRIYVRVTSSKYRTPWWFQTWYSDCKNSSLERTTTCTREIQDNAGNSSKHMGIAVPTHRNLDCFWRRTASRFYMTNIRTTWMCKTPRPIEVYVNCEKLSLKTMVGSLDFTSSGLEDSFPPTEMCSTIQ